MKILYFILYFKIIFFAFCNITFANIFSGKVKNKDFLIVYKNGLAFARYSKIENINNIGISINNTNLKSELQQIQQNEQQKSQNNIKMNNKTSQNVNQSRAIPLSQAYFRYEYKELEDGIFELENGAILSVKNKQITIIKDRKYKAFDEFFTEKNAICNNLKFDFIYQNFLLRESFYGYYYQLYIPYYFSPVILILIYNQKTKKINHLVTSSNHDFSCFYNKKFYNYNSILDFQEKSKKKLEEIKKEKKEITTKKKYKITSDMEEKMDLEINFKYAFQSLLVANDILREEIDTQDADFFDNINTFDYESLNFYKENKNLPMPFNKTVINIEDCDNIKLDEEIISKFKWLNLK